MPIEPDVPISADTPIPPDTKDWTWVLTRPCPECGFEAFGFERSQVGSMLRDNAATWGSVLTAPAIAQRPSADVWSALEYACHVRDVCRLYDERLELMLTQDDPSYPNWDQDETAIEQRYGHQDPTTVSRELETAAARLADRFDGVTGTEWERSGNRSDGARFTVESFSRYFVHDLVHHVHDVEAGFARIAADGG